MQPKSWKWKLAQYIELRWWKNYLLKKNPAEYLSWKKDYWKQILNNIPGLSLTENIKVLECGCGPAGVFISLPQNISVDAMDPLLAHYEKDLHFLDKSLYPNVNFHAVPLEDFNPGVLYDVIFCMNVINHVSNINACYDKLSALLKPGKLLIISIDAHNYLYFKSLFRTVPGDILHPHQYDLAEYEQFLKKRGFTIIKTQILKEEFIFNHYLQVAEKK